GPGPADDRRAEGLADRLVAEADAEHRDAAGEAADGLDRDARLVGRLRPRRDHEVGGLEGLDSVEVDLVVAPHLHLGPELAQVLHEVVGEAVVVVDEDDARHRYQPSVAATSMARKHAWALLRVSSYSRAATESATPPAPACTWATPSRHTIVRMMMQESRSPPQLR